jgi:hypothetical protein
MGKSGIRKFAVVMIVLAGAIGSPKVHCAPTDISLSDEFLMTFETAYNVPLYTAALVGKTDVEGVGVEFDVALGGFGQTTARFGAASPVSDMSAYSRYVLSFTNVSADDHYFTSLYIVTGQTVYESIWYPLMPNGNSIDMALDLTQVDNLNDVKEIGFGLMAYIGQGFGLADAIKVRVEDDETATILDGDPVPEASTLMLFGSGLIGLFSAARRKLQLLSN